MTTALPRAVFAIAVLLLATACMESQPPSLVVPATTAVLGVELDASAAARIAIEEIYGDARPQPEWFSDLERHGEGLADVAIHERLLTAIARSDNHARGDVRGSDEAVEAARDRLHRCQSDGRSPGCRPM
jgi:hypothetical protein